VAVVSRPIRGILYGSSVDLHERGDDVGSVSPTIVPVGVVPLVVRAALALTNLLTLGPAWAARRLRPRADSHRSARGDRIAVTNY
jgi:hypothetical protein